MTTLIETLKQHTQTLKIQYIELNKEWAKNEYTRLRKWAQEYVEGKHGYGAASKKYYNLPYHILNPKSTVDDYVASVVQKAELHYISSISKLAARLVSKGLDVDNITVTSSHIGVNIDIVIDDGEKTVRAYTVVAGGPVQRPHYRYLVK